MALESRGVEFRQAQQAGGRSTADAVFTLVDARTRVVALSHVQFWNGFRVDIEAIGAECRRRGIIFSVDVMQSAGALKVDVARMPIDFCAAGAGKWLMGPPGIGFCHFAPELLQRVRPVIVRVGTAAGPYPSFHYAPPLAPNPRRFA